MRSKPIRTPILHFTSFRQRISHVSSQGIAGYKRGLRIQPAEVGKSSSGPERFGESRGRLGKLQCLFRASAICC